MTQVNKTICIPVEVDAWIKEHPQFNLSGFVREQMKARMRAPKHMVKVEVGDHE